MSQVHVLAAELRARSNTLQRHWESTKAVWRDENALQFERQHWQPFADQLRLTLIELEQLTQTIEAAQRQTHCKQ